MKPSEIDEIERRTDRIPYASIGAERILKLIAHVRRLDKELLELREENERLKAKVLLGDELAEKVDDIYHDPRCSRFTYADGTCDCDYIELIRLRDIYKDSGSRRDEG